MTAKNKTMESPETTTDIGVILKKARLDAGLTLEQVAEKLRLKPEYIEALETNVAVELQKDRIFTRGYVRGYARLLHIATQQVDAALAALVVDDPAPLRAPVINKKSREFSFADKKIRWLTYGIGALLLILIIIWWRSQVVNHVSTTVATPTLNQSGDAAQTFPMINKQIDAEKDNQNKAQEKKEGHHANQHVTPVKKLNMDMQG